MAAIHVAKANLGNLLPAGTAAGWSSVLDRVEPLNGSAAKIRLVAHAPDPEQLQDYLAEILYGVASHSARFGVEFEPLGRRGPDIRLTWGPDSAYVEVLRLRPVNTGPTPICNREDEILLPYGDVERDSQKLYSRLQHKLQQVKHGPSIFAIWNDDPAIEELDVEECVRALRDDAHAGRISLPSQLQFALYGSDWCYPQQFYAFPFGGFVAPYTSWPSHLTQRRLTDLLLAG